MRPVTALRMRIATNATTMSTTIRGRSCPRNLLQSWRQSCRSEVIFAVSDVSGGLNLLRIMISNAIITTAMKWDFYTAATSSHLGYFPYNPIISGFEVIVISKFAISVLVLMGTIGASFPVPIQKDGSGDLILQRRTSRMGESRPQGDARSQMGRDMAKKASEERYAALKRDTDRLLRLSTELKAYVDKSGQNTLSVDVVKKAEEIERLAHSVKEKMKGN